MAFAHYNRGCTFKKQGKLDEAINEAIRFDPNDAAAYNDRGNAYFNKGALDKAINDYNDAIRLNPN